LFFNRIDKCSCYNQRHESLFSAEIGRNFSPNLGLPFQNRIGIAVFVQPFFGSGYQFEDDLVSRRFFEFGVAFFALYPYVILAVGIK